MKIYLYTCKLLESRSFTLGHKYSLLKDFDRYVDYLWVVKTTGDDPLEFRVEEQRQLDLDWSTPTVITDYTNAVLLHEAENFDGFSLVNYETSSSYILLPFQLSASFSTREELDAIFQELTEFYQSLSSHHDFTKLENYALPYTFSIPLYLKTSWPNYHGSFDYIFSLQLNEIKPEALAELKSEVLRYAVEFRHPIMDSFTREEILDAVAQARVYRIGISRSGPDGPYRYYDDLCNVTDEKSLCYRTLYEIASREGLPVEGTVDRFLITNTYGQVCEFSCEFYDLTETGRPHYYHFEDGEKITDGPLPRIKIKDAFLYLSGFYLSCD